MSLNGWIAVDLDGTLAEYHGWRADGSIGAPIPAMVERVKRWLAEGKDVRIFTARVWPLGTNAPAENGRIQEALAQNVLIAEWCYTHLGRTLPITCVKDFGMIVLYDDRCRQVELNTGVVVGEVDVPEHRFDKTERKATTP